jgi:hypothetical protein
MDRQKDKGPSFWIWHLDLLLSILAQYNLPQNTICDILDFYSNVQTNGLLGKRYTDNRQTVALALKYGGAFFVCGGVAGIYIQRYLPVISISPTK